MILPIPPTAGQRGANGAGRKVLDVAAIRSLGSDVAVVVPVEDGHDIVAASKSTGLERAESELRRQRYQTNEPCFTIYHDAEYRDRNIDSEVCEPVGSAPVESRGRVKVYELPAITAASIVHHGTFDTLTNAYKVILKWIEDNGYRICGPERELYLHTGSGQVRQDDPSYVTEVQFPVVKNG